MSDWFTGSANVLIKTLVREVFGISPDLGGVKLTPSAYMPFKSCEIRLGVKNKIINLSYKNAGRGKRSVTVNGKPANITYNAAKQNYETYLTTDALLDVNYVEVTD